jgi:ribonuclease BN (tRNA processing enzyme)
MRVTFCGTASSALTPPRAASCILLDHDGEVLLLDCGPGSLERIIRLGPRLSKVRGLLISHMHMDHVQGFPELLAHMVFPSGTLPFVHGPAGIRPYVDAAVALTNLVSRLPGQPPGTPFELDVTEIAGGDERDVLSYTVRSVEVPHAPDVTALARRIRLGARTLVFSGDSQPVPDIMVPLADGADVLIHECYSEAGLARWGANLTPRVAEAVAGAFRATHSDVASVARIAAAAGVRKLVLTHLNEGERDDELLVAAHAHFGGEVVVAADGLAFEV